MNPAFDYTKKYLLNPVFAIRILPRLMWWHLAVIQGVTSLIAVAPDFAPEKFVLLNASTLGLTFFLGYALQLFQNLRVQWQQVATLTILSQIPFFLIYPFSTWLPPINLITFCVTCILLAVGARENFECSQKFAIRLGAFLLINYSIIWSAGLLAR